MNIFPLPRNSWGWLPSTKRYLTLPILLCLASTGAVAADADTQRLRPNVADSATQTPEDYAHDAQLQGIARPKREAFLGFATIGQVSQIHVTEGANVQTGEALITLDDRVQSAEVFAARVAAESKAAVAEAKVAVQRAERTLQRVREARAAEASFDVEVEARQSDYDQAIAALEQQIELQQSLQAQLELALAIKSQMTLTAPFDGQVILIGVKLGNTVDTTASVIQVADLSVLEVEMHLPSSLYGQVSAGQTMALRAGTPVNRNIEASVRYVSPVIEPVGGTFLVRLEIDNSDGALPAGFEVRLH